MNELIELLQKNKEFVVRFRWNELHDRLIIKVFNGIPEFPTKNMAISRAILVSKEVFSDGDSQPFIILKITEAIEEIRKEVVADERP